MNIPVKPQGVKLSVTNKSIGKFIRRDTCRFCQGVNLSKILDLGDVPLAGGFLKEITHPAILEIGCNDGVLLRPFLDLGVKTIGVDPATNVVRRIVSKEAIIINDFFSEKTAVQIKEKHGSVNALVSSFSFAHIDDKCYIIKG